MLADGLLPATIDDLSLDEAKALFKLYSMGLKGEYGHYIRSYNREALLHSQIQLHIQVNSKNYKTVNYSKFKDLYPEVYANMTLLEPKKEVKVVGMKISGGLANIFKEHFG